MKIVYFCYVDNAIGPLIRTLELAKACADNGINVSLHFMSRGFKPPAFVFDRIRAYQGDQLRIHYPKRFEAEVLQASTMKTAPQAAPGEPRSRSLGLLKQSVLSLRHIATELRILKTERPDAVMARPDHAFSFCLSSRLARLPLVLDTDGPVEELALYWGISSRLFPAADAWRGRVSHAVLVISRVCEELWHDKVDDRSRFFVVPNGTHESEFAPMAPERRAALRQKLGLQGCRVIGYSGNQRIWHGLPALLRSAVPLLIQDPQLKVLIIGCGFNEELKEQCGIPAQVFRQQILFTGQLSYWDMAAYIDQADLMVMPYDKLPLFYFSPMRMFEAMSLGKSIVTSHQGQMQDLLDERASVRFFDPADTESLGRVLAASVYDEAFIAQGVRNREYLIREHTWHSRGATIKRALQYAIAKQAGPAQS